MNDYTANQNNYTELKSTSEWPPEPHMEMIEEGFPPLTVGEKFVLGCLGVMVATALILAIVQ